MHEKQNINQIYRKLRKYNIGDSVIVKHGTKDPDLGVDIGCWQGRISMIEQLASDGLVEIRWNSLTLKNMPLSMIIYCEKERLDWQVMNLCVEEIEQTVAKDTEHDSNKVLNEIRKQIAFFFFGKNLSAFKRFLLAFIRAMKWSL